MMYFSCLGHYNVHGIRSGIAPGPAQARDAPARDAAVRVRGVRAALHLQVAAGAAHAPPHRRPALRLPRLRQEVL